MEKAFELRGIISCLLSFLLSHKDLFIPFMRIIFHLFRTLMKILEIFYVKIPRGKKKKKIIPLAVLSGFIV